jgi:hypothetical protein
MSALTSREASALDRHITGNYGADQFRDEDFEEYELADMPEPCDACDFVGMHGEGCPLA